MTGSFATRRPNNGLCSCSLTCHAKVTSWRLERTSPSTPRRLGTWNSGVGMAYSSNPFPNCVRIFVRIDRVRSSCRPTKFYVAEGLARSTLVQNTVSLNVSFSRTETVEVRTLDDILEEVRLPHVDFVSIDVEGLQLNVLRGFNLQKHRPRLLLVEDHLHDLQTHRYLTAKNYQLVKRTARNNWYVPWGTSFTLSTRLEWLLLWEKIWLHAPLRKLRIARNASKKTPGERLVHRRESNPVLGVGY